LTIKSDPEMYILVIGRGYPSSKFPLNGIFEFDQAKALQKAGNKIVFVSVDLRSIRRWRRFGVSHFIKEGIEVYDLSIPVGIFHWKILYYAGRLGLLHLYKKIQDKNGRPDIMHSHFTMVGAISAILKEKFNILFVVTEHSSFIHRSIITSEYFTLGRIAYRNADRVISVSSSLSKSIKKHFNIESTVIHNIADSSVFTYDKKNDDSGFSFISVGDLIPGKGYDLLIEAFHRGNFDKNVFLNIVGEGPWQSKLQTMINKLGLDANVKLTGLKTRYEIAQMMHESNAFVLASHGETFGLVYAEAMVAGLPVIATACGGPEEFVDDANGILLPAGNIDLLSQALIEMYNNIGKFDGAKISEESRRNFSPEAISARLTQLYRGVLNGRPILMEQTNL
jgi:L-malate glycosyltransferase